MKLLVINWRDLKHPLAGGAEAHIQNITSRLVSEFGHDVTFISNNHGGMLPSRERYDNLDLIRFGNEYNFNYLVMLKLKGIINEFKPDLIVEDVNKIPFYIPAYTSVPVMLVIPHLFSETIFKQANIAIASYVYLAEKLMYPIYKNCHVHVISNSTKDDLAQKGYKYDDISVAECGIDHSVYVPGNRKSERPTVCYTGRVKKYKSIDHLIKAAEILKKDIPDIRIVIIGQDDYLSELRLLSEKLGLSDNIEFPGYISHDDKIKLLQESHCLAYTSIKEGWGISNIEANGCGTPVVASNVPGLKDSVVDGESGLLYEYGNIDELAGKIKLILTNTALRKKLEEGALKWASKFTWDRTARLFNQVLEERYPDLYY